MGYFTFPHTRNYDSDLGWLIKKVVEIYEEMKSFVDFQDTIETEFEDVKQKFSALETKVDSWEAELDAFQNNIQSQIDAQNNDIARQFLQIKADIAAQLSAQLADFTAQLNTLRSYTDAELLLNKAYVDTVIQNFIDSIPDLTSIIVFNPIKNRNTDIQTAIDDLYDAVMRVDALTAQEYDNARLTAETYDGLGLTAFVYDTEAGTYIKGQDASNPLYMYSPFTGIFVPLSTVINELAQFHLQGITAEAYDALMLTAQAYDDKMITAYDYDSRGVTP